MWQVFLRGSIYALVSALGGDGTFYGPGEQCTRVHERGYSARAVRSIMGVLPYCLHPVGDSLIWLNRDYKPIGVLPYGLWVKYEDFPWLHVRKDSPDIQQLLAECQQHHGVYYFYGDATDPRNGKKHATELLRKMRMPYEF